MVHDASLSRVRLELAKTTGFPSGSSWHGYEFIAPLTPDGNVDANAWYELKGLCRVTCFWGDEPEKRGQFVHSGHGWCFEYSATSSIYKLDRHRFTPGGYVTITEPDGAQYPFRVVAMTPALPAN